LSKSVIRACKEEASESDEKKERERWFCSHSQNKYPPFISLDISPHCLKSILLTFFGGVEMKKRWLINCVTICILGLTCLPAFAATVPYSTDFSTDPGWVTDQPSNYYWDAASQTYHVQSENHYPGYTPSRYTYKLLPETVGSFELQWDVDVVSCDWSGGIAFGIYDNSLLTGGIPGGQSIQSKICISDYGHVWGVYVEGAGGNVSSQNFVDMWDVGNWYTCYLSYNAATNIVDFAFKARGSDTSIWTYTLNVPGGGFTNDLRYLGSSNSGIGDSGSYPGLSEWAVAEGYIDNVSIVPEPATLLLLGLGGLALLRKRRG
jgi:hypothetical protein